MSECSSVNETSTIYPHNIKLTANKFENKKLYCTCENQVFPDNVVHQGLDSKTTEVIGKISTGISGFWIMTLMGNNQGPQPG